MRTMTEKVYDASDPEQVEKAKEKERVRREQELKDIKELLNAPFGRRFLNRLLNQCNMYQPVFTGNSKTFFNDGMRNVALWLLGDITEIYEEGELAPEDLAGVLLNINKD